jgi:DNA-binding NarL/FixJ family response regulator
LGDSAKRKAFRVKISIKVFIGVNMSIPKKGKDLAAVYLRLPRGLVAKMKARAKLDERTLRGAFVLALRQYLQTKEPDSPAREMPRTAFAPQETLKPQDPQTAVVGDASKADQAAGDSEPEKKPAINLREELKLLTDATFESWVAGLKTEDLRQVARMTRQGDSKEEIAKEMGRSVRTITSRLATISSHFREDRP